MKHHFLVTPMLLASGSSLAADEYPNGSTLKPQHLICKTRRNYKCLPQHIGKDGTLEKVAVDGMKYEIKAGDSDYDAKLYINGNLYMEFAHYGRGLDELSNMMNDKLQAAKANGKKTLMIPKITGNGNYFISSPAFKFGLPVFDGPTEKELKDYKIEFKYKNRIKELEGELEKQKSSTSYYKTEKRILDSENARLRNRLRSISAESESCHERLTQIDQQPINQNRGTLNDITKQLQDQSGNSTEVIDTSGMD